MDEGEHRGPRRRKTTTDADGSVSRAPLKRPRLESEPTGDTGDDAGATDTQAPPICLDMLPVELLAEIKSWLDPMSSLFFRSTSTAMRALTTPADRRWDTETGPILRCAQRVLPMLGLSPERLVDAGRPASSKRAWPRVRSTGRQTPVDEPTLKRYALNAILHAYLARVGFGGEVTDHFGQPWDDNVAGDEVADKKRWNFLRLPASGGSGPDANAVCTLTYAFNCVRGDYKAALFCQSKGSNAAGIDRCFEHATAVYEAVVGRAFCARGVPFCLDPHRHGGPTPRIRAAVPRPSVRHHVFGLARG
ncbi:hypothetical protein pneo_cds_19 [Pandoravirus neocaledonia]|uniref:F-box domain containing protein n=1 Tax=Pandoravirus neocaledonia TaxID=2107708 RepID=A0A2U7UB26_9VIRU|nr:hypothetical protein pneo_cds_19 [Pandoravirus neocaledonia]AVK75626.1 hypothetical protein pneo_cds_19 [Pandoravirus neocaledonia]